MAREEGESLPELTRPDGTFYFVLVTKAGSRWQDENGRSYVYSHKASGSPAKLTQAVKSGRVEYVLYKPGPDFAFSGSGVVRALEEDPTDTTDSEKRLLLDHSEFSTPLELKGNAASLLDELDFLRDRGLSTFNRNSIVPISRKDFDTIGGYAAEGSGAMVDKFGFPGFDESDFDAFQPHKAESNDYKEERIAVREKLWKLRSDLDNYLEERGVDLSGSTNRVSIGGPISSVHGVWLAYAGERSRYHQQLQLNTAISVDGVQVRLNCEPRNADSQALKRFLQLRSQALLDKLKGLDGYRFLMDEKWGDRTKVDKPADQVTLADLGEYEPTTDYFSLGRSFARDSDIVRSPEFAGVARSILFDDLHPVYRMILGPDVDESGIYLMPASGGQAAVHRQATLEKPVPLSTIEPHLDIDEVRKIEEIFGDEPIRAWGSLPTSGETPSTWAKLKPDDVVLVYFDGRYPYVARVAIKFQNKALAGDLSNALSAM